MGKKFIRMPDVIQLTSLSRATINRLIQSGEIPSYKINGRRIFEQGELIEWVQKHRSFEITNVGKKLSALQEALQDEGMIRNLTFQEQMKLYAILNRSMNRQMRSIASSLQLFFSRKEMADANKGDTSSIKSFSKEPE